MTSPQYLTFLTCYDLINQYAGDMADADPTLFGDIRNGLDQMYPGRTGLTPELIAILRTVASASLQLSGDELRRMQNYAWEIRRTDPRNVKVVAPYELITALIPYRQRQLKSKSF
ncbi:MAG: hypothetical protein HYT70_03835 [Candidatus Aenigmarchaeota archaeon]|nr:hypothetical protein [Candidatus Aenigmarchaeota archaeon]